MCVCYRPTREENTCSFSLDIEDLKDKSGLHLPGDPVHRRDPSVSGDCGVRGLDCADCVAATAVVKGTAHEWQKWQSPSLQFRCICSHMGRVAVTTLFRLTKRVG